MGAGGSGRSGETTRRLMDVESIGLEELRRSRLAGVGALDYPNAFRSRRRRFGQATEPCARELDAGVMKCGQAASVVVKFAARFLVNDPQPDAAAGPGARGS